jgi:hypothetical protein
MKTPNTKIQTPEKLKIPSSNKAGTKAAGLNPMETLCCE